MKRINKCGIYQITNTITGNYYIGSSNNIYNRIQTHRWRLSNHTHTNPHLQSAWDKYGEKAFEFSAILLCDIENKLYYEQILLDDLKPVYNIATSAKATFQGRRHTEETRRKMSEAKKSNPISEEHKRKLIDSNRRRVISEETRRKMSEAAKRKVVSEETKRKLSEAGKLRVVSEETRRKLSEAHTGMRMSEETKRKISETKLSRTNFEIGLKNT